MERENQAQAIPVAELKPGMVLSDNLQDSAGKIAFNKDQILTGEHIQLLLNSDIEVANIIQKELNETSPDNSDQEAMAQFLEIMENLKPHFCRAQQQHPLIELLMKYVAKRQLMQGK